MKTRLGITQAVVIVSLMFMSVYAIAQPPWMMGGEENSQSGGGSEAVKQAASRVLAVADERTNSVVVTAPDELIPMIDELIMEIDAVGDDVLQVRVFPLQYADATEMSTMVMSIFDMYGSTSGRGRGGGRGGRGGRGGGRGGRGSSQYSEEDMVLAAADLRTNSVIVSAKGSKMKQIEQTIKDLDTNPAKEQKVHVYTLENANAEELSTILQDMVDAQANRSNGTGTARSSTNRSRNTSNRNTGNTNRNTRTNQSGGMQPQGAGQGRR